jgi:selT/selW/selH-like putative selenoprotein
LAAEIKKHFGLEGDLVRGSGGIFDVTVDNELLFSKKRDGRFPTDREVVETLRGRT